MNAEQAAQFQKLLEDACDRFLAKGGKIVAGVFTRNEDKQCPVTCLSDNPDADREIGFVHGALKKVQLAMNYDMPGDEMWAFIWGFDLSSFGLSSPYVGAYLVGRALRDKYLTPKVST